MMMNRKSGVFLVSHPDRLPAEARRQLPDGCRGGDIDASPAGTFLTFLKSRREEHDFHDYERREKPNSGVALFLSHLMLDLPIMRGSAVYNRRQTPVITRDKDGRIKRGKVAHTTPGFPSYD